MKSDLSPSAVAQRLEALRALYRPETALDGRRRLAAEAKQDVPFATAVARRLEELRALCELTDYLHSPRSVR